eukprot:UN1746
MRAGCLLTMIAVFRCDLDLDSAFWLLNLYQLPPKIRTACAFMESNGEGGENGELVSTAGGFGVGAIFFAVWRSFLGSVGYNAMLDRQYAWLLDVSRFGGQWNSGATCALGFDMSVQSGLPCWVHVLPCASILRHCSPLSLFALRIWLG